jgi:hypothetical protein
MFAAVLVAIYFTRQQLKTEKVELGLMCTKSVHFGYWVAGVGQRPTSPVGDEW